MREQEQAHYAAEEQRDIRRSIEDTGGATCPRCSVGMTTRPIGGGSFGLGYARRRTWLICPRCHRSVIFDSKRGTRN